MIGSSKIADATDSLFAGEKAALLEFMIPFIILMLLGGALGFARVIPRIPLVSACKQIYAICW